MSRWCLLAVRTLGGLDTNPRLSRLFAQTRRLSRSRFIPVRSHAAVPVAGKSSAQPHPIEERDPCRTARSRTGSSAIDTLKRFLSQECATLDRPPIYSPTIIRSLYYHAESGNQLGLLDSGMLTLLISLFGSLSIDPSISVTYRDPLASRLLRVSTRRTHWAFVLKVGRHMLERGILLQDSDRFWLMRAELGTIQARPPFEPLSDDAYSAILRARIHYHIIRRHSRCPEVHAHYLEALLVIRDPRLLNFAACDLAFLLRTHRMCHPRLQRLLYRLAIQHGGSLSTRSQGAILGALWSRSCQGTSGTTALVTENGVLDMASDDYVLDATTIARSLSTTLFGFAGHPPNVKSANLFGHLFSVFSPAYALPLRWSALVLFSIFNSSDVLQLTGTHWTSDYSMPRVTSYWQVIFGLATIEKIILQEPSSALAMQTTPAEGVLETTHTLRRLWLPVRETRLVSRDLACAVAASFLRIASVLADSALFHNCQELYQVEIGSEGPRTSVQKFLAAQYIGAALRVQGSLPDIVLGALEAFSLDSQRQVLASAVKVLAPLDPSLACTLYSLAQEKGIEFDLGVNYVVAMSFAQCGAFREAILFINNSQFSPEKRGVLISAIARSIRENPRTCHTPSVFAAIVDELAALYHSHAPPEHFRGHLGQLFVVLAQHGRGNQSLPVVLSILKRLPKFFQPRFFVRYCHVLIRHRQFSTARKLLGAITTVHPKTARSLCILTDRIVMRTKTYRVFKRIAFPRGPTSVRLSSRLQRRPCAGSPLEISLRELLKSGRVFAAKRVFTRVAQRMSPRRYTALGNILLHRVSCQRTSRNGRRVRKVLALLESLVKDHGFLPDRVTANILIKAMINWRSAFDSPRLRELFDQLVRGGYPAADYSPLHPPFGRRRTQLAGSASFSKLPPFVSFEKHTRPLFKMFIKAFYLCNDVEAARRVVGILKAEEYKHAIAKETRQRARSRGRVKVGQKSAIPLGATVS